MPDSQLHDVDNIIEMWGIWKTFPNVTANQGINFSVKEGEIHALLGENGAGKTTLMKLLYGLYRPDDGEIFLRGQKVSIRSPLDAMNLGIDMIHQHFMLVEPLTVAENVVLGREPTRWNLLDPRRADSLVRETSEQFGLKVDPRIRVQDLSVGEKQRVEIIKALFRGAEILILDEPTAVLTPQEIDELFHVMSFLKGHGKTIIFITHKLRETMAISDRVTVLRKGKLVGTVETTGTSPRELARMMVGRDVDLKMQKGERVCQKPLLQIENLWASNVTSTEEIRGINLNIEAGEIVGIAGIEGNGQGALSDSFIGLVKPTQGRILIDGMDMVQQNVKRRMEMGMAHVPEDRQLQGLIMDWTLNENLILGVQDKLPFSRFGIIRGKVVEKDCRNAIDIFGISPADGKVLARQLSGGNQQRVILARELGTKGLRALLVCQPSRGLDIGAIEFVYEKLLELRREGVAVLLISADLEEIFAISDRIAVIYEGKIVSDKKAEDYTLAELGIRMGGMLSSA
jgi:ABC-type uncharacterized transport system ATPase subunit